MPSKTRRKVSAWPPETEERFSLSRGHRADLCRYAGLTATSTEGRAMLDEVERIVTTWRSWYRAATREVRPAHVREALKEVKKKADSLLYVLKTLDAESIALLRGSHAGNVGRALYGAPQPNIPYSPPFAIAYRPDDLLPALELLSNACAYHLQELKHANSRHAPRTAATTREARAQLGLLFDVYATGKTNRERLAFIDLVLGPK